VTTTTGKTDPNVTDFCTAAPDAVTADIVHRLRRIEGQVRGIQRMLEDGRECSDVLTQLMAIRSGVEQVSFQIVDLHIERCVFADMAIDDGRRAELNRALRLMSRVTPAAAGVQEAGTREPR
jgi:CsoR family transcriptional regulator, copper-sensing transcriptional repressor